MEKTTVDIIFEKFNLLSDADFKSWMLNNYDELFEIEKRQIVKAYNSSKWISTHEDGNDYYDYTYS